MGGRVWISFETAQCLYNKTTFVSAARNQTYPGREQGESPPFISAAAATGSPIIAPGGTFPQPVYPVPTPQVAYVQSPAGMVPQQVVPQVSGWHMLKENNFSFISLYRLIIIEIRLSII